MDVKDVWTVKFANLTRDKAFEKISCFDTLNDTKTLISFINTNDLWSKTRRRKTISIKR